MKELNIIKPDDFHNHLRQGELMSHLVKETANVFQRTLVMPNTIPPITTPEQLNTYREELKAIGTDLEFLMTFKIMSDADPNSISELKKSGAIAAKYYPQGVTTHSEDGIKSIQEVFPIFEALQAEDLVLCIHGELPGADELTAEHEFLPCLQEINQNFPNLRIVFEHTSSKAAVELINELPEQVAATITVHHLYLTHQDVYSSNGLVPQNFCKPIAKTEKDQKALIDAVTSSNPKYFFGTDSAAHPKADKKGDKIKPGVYTTPVALPLLTQLFDEANRLNMLENFTSKFGADFYQLPYNSSQLSLTQEEWTVPAEYFGVIPLKAKESLNWQVVS